MVARALFKESNAVLMVPMAVEAVVVLDNEPVTNSAEVDTLAIETVIVSPELAPTWMTDAVAEPSKILVPFQVVLLAMLSNC